MEIEKRCGEHWLQLFVSKRLGKPEIQNFKVPSLAFLLEKSRSYFLDPRTLRIEFDTFLPRDLAGEVCAVDHPSRLRGPVIRSFISVIRSFISLFKPPDEYTSTEML